MAHLSLTPFHRLAAGLVAALGTLGCANAAPSQHAPQSRLENVDPRILSACTTVGLRLYGQIARTDPDRNLMVSPPSITLALAMAYNGARGETQQAMARALELQGLSLDAVNEANALLMRSLQSADPKVQLNIANSLWAKQGVPFLPDFVQRCRDFYQAEAAELDFQDPNAPAVINAWVHKQTKGRIDRMIERIGREMVLFLVNAIYFKGAWAEKFDPANTREGVFTLADGTQKKHPMMSQTGDYRYYEDETAQAVSLPYGDGRISMYVFLPAPGVTLQAFQEKLSRENWDRWMGQFRRMPGEIVLPRFTFEYDVRLNDALKALGMEVAFTPGVADFTGMVQAEAYITEVRHKTFVEVNEEGAEAAAATSIGIGITSLPQRFQMVVDRPFLFAIRDNPTGALLFLGSVVEPK